MLLDAQIFSLCIIPKALVAMKNMVQRAELLCSFTALCMSLLCLYLVGLWQSTEPVIHNFFWLWWDLPVGSTKIKKILGKWLTPELCVCVCGQGVVSYSTLDFMCWHFETNVSGCRLPAVKICPGHVTEANWNGNALPSRKGASTTLIQENQNCLWGSHRKNACNVIWWTSCIRWVCRLCA